MAARQIWFDNLLSIAKSALDQSVVFLDATSVYGSKGEPTWAEFETEWQTNIQKQKAVKDSLFEIYEVLTEKCIPDTKIFDTDFEHQLISGLPMSCLLKYESIQTAIRQYKNLDLQLEAAFDLLNMARDYQAANFVDESYDNDDVPNCMRPDERFQWSEKLVTKADDYVQSAGNLLNDAAVAGDMEALTTMLKLQKTVVTGLAINSGNVRERQRAKIHDADFQEEPLRLLMSHLASRPEPCVQALSKYELGNSKLAAASRLLKTAQDYGRS